MSSRRCRRVGWCLALLVLMLLPPLVLDGSWLRVGQYVMIGAVGAIGLTLLTGQAGPALPRARVLPVRGRHLVLRAGGRRRRRPRRLRAAAAARRRGRGRGDGGAGPGVRPGRRTRPRHLPGRRHAVAGLPRALPRPGAALDHRRHRQRAQPGRLRGVRVLLRSQRPRAVGVRHRDGRQRAALVPVRRVHRDRVRPRAGRGAQPARAGRGGRSATTRRRPRPSGVPGPAGPVRGVRGVVRLRGPGRRHDGHLVRPAQARRERVRRHLEHRGLHRLPRDGDHRGHGLRARAPSSVPCSSTGCRRRLELSIGGFGSGAGAVTPAILTSFVFGAAIIGVVLFEPGGLAAIGRRLAAASASPLPAASPPSDPPPATSKGS